MRMHHDIAIDRIHDHDKDIDVDIDLDLEMIDRYRQN